MQNSTVSSNSQKQSTEGMVCWGGDRDRDTGPSKGGGGGGCLSRRNHTPLSEARTSFSLFFCACQPSGRSTSASEVTSSFFLHPFPISFKKAMDVFVPPPPPLPPSYISHTTGLYMQTSTMFWEMIKKMCGDLCMPVHHKWSSMHRLMNHYVCKLQQWHIFDMVVEGYV